MLISRVLYPIADAERSTLSLLQWWETRRPMYNIVVGGAGLFTLAVAQILTSLPVGVDFTVPWQPVVAYGMLANIGYSAGWLVETALQKLWGPACPPVGPALFRQGLAFSVGLTLLPSAIMTGGWVVSALAQLL
jgi:hypothetical protein